MPMRTFAFTFLLIISFIQITLAQPPQKDWDKRYGGAVTISPPPATPAEITSQIIRYHSHYAICGRVQSEISGDVTETTRDMGTSDYWIIKTDFASNLIWDKRFGSTNADVPYGLKSLDNHYYVAGFSASDAGGDRTDPQIGSVGGGDYWIIKMDTNRNKIWDKAFGGTGPGTKQSDPSLAESNGLRYTLYPNPAREQITLQYSGVSEAGGVIEIYDALSRLLMTKPLTGTQGETELDVSHLSSGLYLWRLRSGEQPTGLQKLLINR